MALLPTIQREPVARLRLMALWFALFAVAIDVFAVASGHLASWPARLAGLGASLVLLVWMLRGYKRGHFAEWTTPVEAALLAAIAAGSSLPLRAMGVFIAVLMLRALYVTKREFWLLPLSYGMGRAAGMALTPEPRPYSALSSTVLFQTIGLVFIAGMLFVLMQALEAQARAEAQLREAQKMEAVGQLAGGLAHDFNNLLTVIGGHVYMLERATPETPERTKHLDGITHTIERAGALTRQLLAFGRRQVLHPTLVDLNAVARSASRMLEPVVGDHVQIAMDLEDALPRVRADVGQLEQVLLNFGLNARDAMPSGGTLHIGTKTVTGNGARQARVSFTDTGVGMDADTLAHVFEPFFTTKRGGRGTGLGLATAYGIIKQSGGDIEVTSAPGKGSTFTITLPVAEPVRAPERVEGMPMIPTGLRVKRALVVEDADGVREFVRAALMGAGVTVFAAADGTEGLEIARTEGYAFDVVVTDIVMPGVSGPQMVERLREARPGLPVLFITGYAGDALAQEELKAPCTGLIEKPFSVRTLLEAVQAAAGDAPAANPSGMGLASGAGRT